MTNQEIQALLERQRVYYRSGATLPVSFRIAQLKKLYAAVKKYEPQIAQALRADLGKSAYEGFMCETGLVLSEISYMIRHVRRFARRRTVHTPLAQFASHSYKQPVPYGNTLIMSPWNYPFLLTIDPLTDAIAEGNTAIVKPSAYSPAARCIVFGKYLNCGQTCVAPDYILCERSVKDDFVAEVIWQVRRQYGEKPLDNPDYGKIINDKHFQRLCALIDPEKVVHGGEWDAASCRFWPSW